MLKIQVKHFVMPYLWNFQKVDRELFFILQHIGIFNKLCFKSNMNIHLLFTVHFALRS